MVGYARVIRWNTQSNASIVLAIHAAVDCNSLNVICFGYVSFSDAVLCKPTIERAKGKNERAFRFDSLQAECKRTSTLFLPSKVKIWKWSEKEIKWSKQCDQSFSRSHHEFSFGLKFPIWYVFFLRSCPFHTPRKNRNTLIHLCHWG